MAVFETERGKRLTITLPPSPWLELSQVADTYRRLTGEEKATRTRLNGLHAERERAVEQDAYELGQALKEKRKPKASTKVETLDKEIKAAERHLAGVESAIESASTDLIDVVDEHKEEWDRDAEAQLQGAQSQYAEAVEAAAAAARKVFEKLALLRWVRLFPEVAFYSVGDGKVPGLMAPNGELYTAGAVFSGLHDQAQIEWNPQLPRDPQGAATQALHEARRANEVAGRGYMTDQERALFEVNPFQFFNGADSSPLSKMPVPLVFNGNETDAEEEG